MKDQTLIQAIAVAIEARANCERFKNGFGVEWDARLKAINKEALPSGSGFDNGTRVMVSDSTPDKIVFSTEYHHMNETGYYTGWTRHLVTVRPAFVGFNVSVSGRDKNEIKSYIAETFNYVLGQPYAFKSTISTERN